MFSSAPCSAGKTYQMVNRACQYVNQGKNVLLLQPTILLSNATYEEEFVRNHHDRPIIDIFNTETKGTGVGRKLADYMADPRDEPHIIMANHQVLSRIPYLSTASDWHLMIDETPQIDRCQEHIFPDTHKYITDLIDVDPFNATYGIVRVCHMEEMKRLGRNESNDDLKRLLMETANILASPHHDTFVNLEQYQRLITGSGERLTFHSLLKPSIVTPFGSVFMAAANFEDSGVHHFWKQQGITFRPDDDFKLKFAIHGNGHLVDVYYATDSDWSAKKRDKVFDGVTSLDQIKLAIEKVFRASEYLWQANKVIPDDYLEGKRLPHVSLGLNAYSDVHKIALLSALNPTPAHENFLKDRGFTSDQIMRMGYGSAVYQSIMRTSLRDSNNTDRKTIIVVDRRAAEFIAEKLPGATLHKMETGIVEAYGKVGRPRSHSNNVEKSQKRRADAKEKKRVQLLLDMTVLNGSQDNHGKNSCRNENSANLRTETGIDLIPHFGTEVRYQATIFANKSTAFPEFYLTSENDESFINMMRLLNQVRRKSKEDNRLISPAIFDPSIEFFSGDKRRYRGRGNIVSMQFMMLDFEDGDLRPHQFAGMFPNLRMIITNSWGHTDANPRFRVIIFTTCPMTADVYEVLFDMFVMKLKDCGFVAKQSSSTNYHLSGLDASKRSATSMFYLPSQAEVEEFSFFDVYDGAERRALDPVQWIENGELIVHDEFETISIQPSDLPIDQDKFDQAVAQWRMAARGEGNQQFYLLGVAMKKLGMTPSEIKAILVQEARNGRSPDKRKNQIPSIMNSLSQWRQLVE